MCVRYVAAVDGTGRPFTMRDVQRGGDASQVLGGGVRFLLTAAGKRLALWQRMDQTAPLHAVMCDDLIILAKVLLVPGLNRHVIVVLLKSGCICV